MTMPPLALVALASSLMSGCAAHQFCVKPVGDPQNTPNRVAISGQSDGQVVTWGGVVVTGTAPAATEVMAYPLNACGQPIVNDETIGHFRIQPAQVQFSPRAGQQLTATGRLRLERGAALPILDDAAVHLWSERPPAAPATVSDGYLSPILFWPFITISITGGGGRIGGGFGIHF